MEVIGAGCGRTGTVSLKTALEILGYDPCYHMIEVFKNKHGHFWVKVANGESYDFDEAFKRLNYKASCDFPSAIYWKEQLDRYPNAKVILTMRDPEKWFKSASDTILCSMNNKSLGLMLFNWSMGMDKLFQVMVRDFFRGDLSKENVIKCYEQHNARVIAECPKDKLLVYDVKQGWEPLCTFLDKPIPSVPFPHLNDTSEFQGRIRIFEAIAYGAVAALAVPLACLLWYAVKDGRIAQK